MVSCTNAHIVVPILVVMMIGDSDMTEIMEIIINL